MEQAQQTRQVNAQKVCGLYIIVDPQATLGRDVVEVARAALQGGATAIQLRDKVHDKGDLLPDAERLTALCQDHNAAFIINDHADLAAACGAHGLHLGQDDLPIVHARKDLHPWQFVGRSSALLEEALASQEQRADYIAVGSMFPTDSKTNTRPAGLDTLRSVRQAIPILPIVAIGGINPDNVDEVVRAGADGICVMGAVCSAQDPEVAARRLVERIREAQIHP